MALRIHLLFAYIALCLLSLYNANAFTLFKTIKADPRIVGFGWSNCGPASDPFKITSLAISPSPVKIPGNITIAMNLAVTAALPADMHSSVNMEKKVGPFWVKVPCEHNVGSCNYGNLCQGWATDCPKYFEKYGIPCTCPIPANTYSIPDAIMDVTAKLPSGAAGDFQVSIDIGSGSGHIGCVKLSLTLSG